MRIYERIRNLCKVNGITVTGLEKSLGFARGSLSKIDTNRPSFERISKLADSLGVTTDYLMTGETQSWLASVNTTVKSQQKKRRHKAPSTFTDTYSSDHLRCWCKRNLY